MIIPRPPKFDYSRWWKSQTSIRSTLRASPSLLQYHLEHRVPMLSKQEVSFACQRNQGYSHKPHSMMDVHPYTGHHENAPAYSLSMTSQIPGDEGRADDQSYFQD